MSVELPKDAKGREIPFDTEYLYTCNGVKQSVLSFTYYREKDRWEIETDTLITYSIYFYLTPPDSWKKLEEDLDSCCVSTRYIPCAYFNNSNDACEKCPADPSKECIVQMAKHIALRVHNLRGESE